MGNIFGLFSQPTNNEDGENQNRRGFASSVIPFLINIIVLQAIFYLMKNRTTQNTHKTTSNEYTLPFPIDNIFKGDTQYDLFIYMTNTTPNDLESLLQGGNMIWALKDLHYTHNYFSKPHTFNYTLDLEAFNNQEIKNLYISSVIVPHQAYIKQQFQDQPLVSNFKPSQIQNVIVSSKSLIKTIEPIKEDNSDTHASLMDTHAPKNLVHLDEDEDISPQPHLMTAIDSYLIYQGSQLTQKEFYSGNYKYFRFDFDNKRFLPAAVLTDFWLVERHYINLSKPFKEPFVKIEITHNIGSPLYLSFIENLEVHLKQQAKMGLHTRRETFMFKRIVLDTHPFMLAFSIAFMTLHSVFSFFAFKNDMQFWQKNESMEGLSALSIIFSFVCEIIVALYLFDSKNTSWLILFEICIGLALSIWKVTKAVKISISLKFPFIKFASAKNYQESDTKKYDEIAIKYMSIALAPCLVGYAIYALYNYKYRSWYSYIISVLAGVVYTFGFIMMTPQLYINYKMKSVDHLPWRALIYKSLNTFVDDVASFLIDMPWMHRLSCFRDDIIFIIYLYQRWIYSVDKKRPNQWNKGQVDPAITEDTHTNKIEGDVQETNDNNEGNSTNLITTTHTSKTQNKVRNRTK